LLLFPCSLVPLSLSLPSLILPLISSEVSHAQSLLFDLPSSFSTPYPPNSWPGVVWDWWAVRNGLFLIIFFFLSTVRF
jgi:hypothetical protein